MTFDQLAKLSVAIRAKEINLDYFARVLKMVVEPEYGFNEAIKNRKFQLVFKDCIYLCCCNTSRMAWEGETEFIAWGKHLEKLHSGSTCKKLLNDFLGKTIGAGSERFGFVRINVQQHFDIYQHYYFQNTLGDAMEILCSKALVTDVTERG
jgi:hypothetical protein